MYGSLNGENDIYIYIIYMIYIYYIYIYVCIYICMYIYICKSHDLEDADR